MCFGRRRRTDRVRTAATIIFYVHPHPGGGSDAPPRYTSHHCPVEISRKKAADTGSLLTHFICFSFRSIIYEAKGEELYNSRVEQLLAEYLIDTLPLEFLPLLFVYAR